MGRSLGRQGGRCCMYVCMYVCTVVSWYPPGRSMSNVDEDDNIINPSNSMKKDFGQSELIDNSFWPFFFLLPLD